MFPILRPILNRGGAGYSVSRAETAERLRPFVPRHHRLLHAYDFVLARMADGEGARRLRAMLPYARTESGKLAEILFSLGTVAPNGTDLDAADFHLPGDADADRLRLLAEMEGDYHDALVEEVDAVHHQERTRAILNAVAKGSAARRDLLRELLSAAR